MKSFSHWSIEEVEDEFGIKLKKKSSLLEDWLDVDPSPSSFEQQWLDYIRNNFEENGFAWSEQDLIGNFIGPLLTLVNFHHTDYRGFLNSEVSVPYGDDTLSGEIDYLVAQGHYSPKRLFFQQFPQNRCGAQPEGSDLDLV
ncbi:MAG: hypothetical protein AAF639_46705 [Chloroflexota bacterium]